jgi:hypothetical protein
MTKHCPSTDLSSSEASDEALVARPKPIRTARCKELVCIAQLVEKGKVGIHRRQADRQDMIMPLRACL